jgi:tRNA threonylcarbamoyladenosine biosynthesis protein TsaB
VPDPDAPGLLLAIETATGCTSAALLRGEELLGEESAEPGAPTAECLLPAIDRLLARSGRTLAAVRAFAVSVGPGSFTGLRIGVATVKGLAFASARPVAAIPTLAALARGAGASGGVVVATLDAQRGELYAAGYAAPECWRPVVPEGLYGPDELVAMLPAECRIVGEADARAGAALRARLTPHQRLETGPARMPRARDVGTLAVHALARGEGIPAEVLVPRYVRRAEAEARRLREPTEAPPSPRRAL